MAKPIVDGLLQEGGTTGNMDPRCNRRRNTTREIRQRIVDALTGHDSQPDLNNPAQMPRRQTLRALFAVLCDPDPMLKGRAVTALGRMVADLAREDLEEAREVVRRLTWRLNEESGSSGWGAPEALAEIMAQHEGLAEEYTHMLVSYMRRDGNYLENEALQRGLLWGLARLGQVRPDLLHREHAHLYLSPFLESRDGQVRGLAAWCAGVLGCDDLRGHLACLLEDETEVILYRGGRVGRCRTGELAREALTRLNAKPVKER